MEKKLYRSKTDRKLFGVCGGVANFFSIDPTIVRVIWAVLCLFAFIGVVIYIVCALLIPEEPETYIDAE